MSRVSLRDVAGRAGVSLATVSRVLSGAPVRVSPETRKRIHSVASELGYLPNALARALITGRTGAIALWNSGVYSPYYKAVINRMHSETDSHDYDLMIGCIVAGERRAFYGEKVSAWPVDGIMVVDIIRGDVPGLKDGLLSGKPLVAVGGYVPERADHVRINTGSGVNEAVQHLHTVGCRRIAYLVPDWFDWFRSVDDNRLLGYEMSMAELGEPAEFIRTPQEMRRCVGPVLKEYIGQHGCPEGLFCYNDDMAIGALAALRDLGLRVPDDVALIGCDGIEDGEYHEPPITTVVQPIAEMCATAWSFLHQRIESPTLPLQHATLTARLEIRGSTRRR